MISIVITLHRAASRSGCCRSRAIRRSRRPRIAGDGGRIRARRRRTWPRRWPRRSSSSCSGLQGTAVLHVGQRERRDDEAADLLRRHARRRTSRRWTCRTRCSWRCRSCPAPVRQNGVTILKANTDILAVAALTSSDPALRRAVPHQLLQAVRRGRAEARARDRQRADVRRPAVLDAAAARPGADGAAAASRWATSRRRCASRTRPIPRGGIGREPAPAGTAADRSRSRRWGASQTPEQFDDIVVRAKPDGSLVRLRDVGRAVLGSQNYDFEARLNGKPTAFVLLYLRPGANALAGARRGGAAAEGAVEDLPAGHHAQHPLRHHAVRHRARSRRS